MGMFSVVPTVQICHKGLYIRTRVYNRTNETEVAADGFVFSCRQRSCQCRERKTSLRCKVPPAHSRRPGCLAQVPEIWLEDPTKEGELEGGTREANTCIMGIQYFSCLAGVHRHPREDSAKCEGSESFRQGDILNWKPKFTAALHKILG